MVVSISTGTSKALNSTKRATDFANYDCVLKSGTSVTNPVITLSVADNVIPSIATAKCAYIAAFGRYYFIHNVVVRNDGLLDVHLSVDVLATYKTNILSSSQYISRCSVGGSKFLYDETWTHAENTFTMGEQDFSIPLFSSTGSYVLQTIGSGANGAAGSNSAYAVSASTLNNMLSSLFNSDFYGDGIVDDNVKTYFNPFQYITSCRWFPMDLTSMGTSTPIKFGWWTSPYSGAALSGNSINRVVDIVMPAALNWTAYSPDWTRYNLVIPGIGGCEIDPIYSGKILSLSIYVDILTGQATAHLYNDGALVQALTGQWGIDIQIAQLSSDTSNLGSTIIGSIVGVKMGGEEAPSVAGWIQDKFENAGYTQGEYNQFIAKEASILNTFIPFVGGKIAKSAKNAMSPSLSLLGAVGNMSYMRNFGGIVRLTWKQYDVWVNSNGTSDSVGLPVRRYMEMKDVSGYCICENVKLDISGTDSEYQALKIYMEGGFFVE